MNLIASLLFIISLAAQDTSVVSVVFLEVGQSDAVIIQSPEGRLALVDGGRSTMELAWRLNEAGVDTIDLVAASHGDADHIGGLAEMLGLLSLAVHARVGLAQMRGTIYAFPTFYGPVGEAVGAYGRGLATVLDPSYPFAVLDEVDPVPS